MSQDKNKRGRVLLPGRIFRGFWPWLTYREKGCKGLHSFTDACCTPPPTHRHTTAGTRIAESTRANTTVP